MEVYIHPEKVSPYGKVSVELKNGDQEQFNTTDVQKLSNFLAEKGVKPKVGDVGRDNTFSVFHPSPYLGGNHGHLCL